MIIFDDKSEPIITAEKCAKYKFADVLPDAAISCYSKKLLDAFLESNPHKLIAESHCASNVIPFTKLKGTAEK